MKFQDKLKRTTRSLVWDEYCGFLDLSLEDYMFIQNRLMREQLELWCASGLGRSLYPHSPPASVDEFRALMPLTVYEDYADVLLRRRADMLPAEPIVWIQTTWEGGVRPLKLAPYSRQMLDAYKHNTESIMMLATSRRRGDFDIGAHDTVLYGGAPLPYATGLLPSLLDEDINLSWLPDANVNSTLSFSQRIKKGFEMAYSRDIDYFFAIGSVANYITESFASKGGRHVPAGKIRLSIALRYLVAKYICRRDGRGLLPRDLFRIKGFVAAGTDSHCYKDKLAAAWGVTPIEIAAGTESTCIGSETWEHQGMTFFPDACFYEFIHESEMRRSLSDPSYVPKTCLMDGVRANNDYELVITVLKGGAFARYRIGDVYRCLPPARAGGVPRFTFLDRIPTVIDIAGFTRITEKSVAEVIELSKLGIGAWLAKKEFTRDGTPFLHMYIEMLPDAVSSDAVSRRLLTEHLSAYYKYFDSDYDDLKKLLNIDPLQITILKTGSVARYEAASGSRLPRINPSSLDVEYLLKSCGADASAGEGAAS